MTPDSSFGNDDQFGQDSNKLVAGFAFGYDAAFAGALQSDGDIVAAGGTNQAPQGQCQSTPQGDIDFGVARFTGAGTAGPPGFEATVHELSTFELQARPATFQVFWAAVKAPGPTEKFDVRTRTARYYQTKYDGWRVILTKTAKTSTKLSVTPGTTICVEARAHSGGFTS